MMCLTGGHELPKARLFQFGLVLKTGFLKDLQRSEMKGLQ